MTTAMSEAAGQEPVVAGQEPAPAGVTAQQEPSAPAVDETGQEPEPEKFDADYVRKLRREAAEARKRARELEQQVKQHEEAKLSEQERLQRRVQELEAEQQRLEEERAELAIRDATTRAAFSLGVDPELAHRLVAVERIELGEDGQPANVEALLREALKRWPQLRGTTAPPVAPTNPANPPQQRSRTYTTSQITDRRFWEQHRDDILAATREGRIVEG